MTKPKPKATIPGLKKPCATRVRPVVKNVPSVVIDATLPDRLLKTRRKYVAAEASLNHLLEYLAGDVDRYIQSLVAADSANIDYALANMRYRLDQIKKSLQV